MDYEEGEGAAVGVETAGNLHPCSVSPVLALKPSVNFFAIVLQCANR